MSGVGNIASVVASVDMPKQSKIVSEEQQASGDSGDDAVSVQISHEAREQRAVEDS